MKTLHFLRHAKSDWSTDFLNDHERPLNARGRSAATKMGLFMQRTGISPDKIVCSSAVRARETLELVKSAAGLTCKIDIEPDLYGASADAILRVVRRQPSHHQDVLFVGHNPGFEDLVLGLSGAEAKPGDLAAVRKKFPTAAFASIEFSVDQLSKIGLGAGRLVHYVRPKDKTIV